MVNPCRHLPIIRAHYCVLTVSHYRRPITVCLCVHFPVEPYKIDTRVIILQHKDEV